LSDERDNEEARMSTPKALRSLTYANVMSTIAVVGVVAGGTAYALPGKNSVHSDDIARGEVTARDLARTRIVTQTELASDPNPGDGLPTPTTVTAPCPRGARLLTGGFSLANAPPDVKVNNSQPTQGARTTSWSVLVGSDDALPVTVVAYALCLSGGS
jgi:hypothetical protein